MCGRFAFFSPAEAVVRLFGVLRTDRGLTYGASADLQTFKSSGGYVASTNTRTETTGEALRLLVDEITRLTRERVGERELGGVVVGVDEVGRGPLAGPVLAAACVFPAGKLPRTVAKLIDDSKKLNAAQREAAFGVELKVEHGVSFQRARYCPGWNARISTAKSGALGQGYWKAAEKFWQ